MPNDANYNQIILNPLRAWSLVSSSAFSSRREFWILILIALDMFFMIRGFAVSNLIEHIILILVISSSELRQRFLTVFKQHKFLIPLMLMWAWIAVSGLYSAASLLEIMDDIWSWRKILLIPLMIMLLTNSGRTHFFLSVFATIGIGFLLLSISMDITDARFTARSASNILQNHSAQGVYFSLTGTLLALNVHREQDYHAKIILLILSAAFFYNTFAICDGRSGHTIGLIGFTVSVFAVLGLSRAERPKLKPKIIFSLFAVTMLVGVAVVFELHLFTGLQKAFYNMSNAFTADSKTSGGIRVVMWINTIEMIKDSFWLGTGAGGFEIGYSGVVENQNGWQATITNNPHQQFLQIWAEYGIVAFGLFNAFLFGLAKHIIRLEKVPEKTILIFILGSYLIMFMFNGAFTAPVEGRILMFILPILLIHAQFVTKVDSPNQPEIN